MVDWITLASFNESRLDLKRLMPGEARMRMKQVEEAIRRVRRYAQLFGPACAVPDLRRARVNRVRLDLGGEDDGFDVIGVMSRMVHLRGAPASGLARASDPEVYAFGLVFRDLRIGCAGLYTEVPSPRAALFWWGDRDETLARIEAISGDAAGFDEVWERVRCYPDGPG